MWSSTEKCRVVLFVSLYAFYSLSWQYHDSLRDSFSLKSHAGKLVKVALFNATMSPRWGPHSKKAVVQALGLHGLLTPWPGRRVLYLRSVQTVRSGIHWETNLAWLRRFASLIASNPAHFHTASRPTISSLAHSILENHHYRSSLQSVRMSSYSGLFDNQAASYAEFRPVYPSELYDKLYDYYGVDRPKDLALDIATGSGQAALEISKQFTKVGHTTLPGPISCRGVHRKVCENCCANLPLNLCCLVTIGNKSAFEMLHLHR